jgi:hypothetical protein
VEQKGGDAVSVQLREGVEESGALGGGGLMRHGGALFVEVALARED